MNRKFLICILTAVLVFNDVVYIIMLVECFEKLRGNMRCFRKVAWGDIGIYKMLRDSILLYIIDIRWLYRWQPLGKYSHIIEYPMKKFWWENDHTFAKRNLRKVSIFMIYSVIDKALKKLIII